MKTTLKMNKTLFKEIKQISVMENSNIDDFINELIKQNREEIKESIYNKNETIIEILENKEKLICIDLSEENRNWCKEVKVKFREVIIISISNYLKNKKKGV